MEETTKAIRFSEDNEETVRVAIARHSGYIAYLHEDGLVIPFGSTRDPLYILTGEWVVFEKGILNKLNVISHQEFLERLS